MALSDLANESVGTLAGHAIDKILAGDQQGGGNELGAAIVAGVLQEAAPVIALLAGASVVLLVVAGVWTVRTFTK